MTPAGVEPCLGLWAETTGGHATLVNHSENHTFRVDAAAGRFFLRVHRPGYQSAAAIASELAWLTALRAETGLPVPRPLAGRDGEIIQRLSTAGAAPRHAVLFAAEPGREPTPADDLSGLFETLGRYAATAHRHAEKFRPPAGFVRPRWDATILDANELWGDWRKAPHVDGSVAAILTRLDGALRADLAAYGTAPGRFGLIHADMRLANLLMDGSTVKVDDRYLHDSIMLPDSQVVAGYAPIMPSYEGRIGEEDVLALLAYIKSSDQPGPHPTEPSHERH